MNMDCRWVLYGLLSGGMLNNFNLGSLLSRRAQLISTTLRFSMKLLLVVKKVICLEIEKMNLRVI